MHSDVAAESYITFSATNEYIVSAIEISTVIRIPNCVFEVDHVSVI